MPQGHRDPVEHEAVHGEPEPEALDQLAPERTRVGAAPLDEHHGGHQAHERRNEEMERGIREEGEDCSCGDEPPVVARQGQRFHRTMSRPWSAERYTASSVRCRVSWSERSGGSTCPRATARKWAHSARYDAVNASSLPEAPAGVTFE